MILHRIWLLVLVPGMLIACKKSQIEQENVNSDTLGFYEPSGDTTSTATLPEENFEQLVEIYEDPERRDWQNPGLVVDKLGDLRAKTVADIGTGTGYFAFRLAQNAQKVIAIDIDERFIEYIEDRKLEMPDSIADRLETRLTSDDDPSLREREADVVLLVNTYPFITNRTNYFLQVKKGLNMGGKLAILDYKKGDLPVGPPDEIKITPEQVIEELKLAGFTRFNIDTESLRYQYIVMAEM